MSPPPPIRIVSIDITIDTTIVSFDEAAQLTFRQGLAAQLDGILPSDITLSIAAGSIIVTATIATNNASSAEAVELRLLSLSPSELSTAIGQNVLALSAPIAAAAPAAATGLSRDDGRSGSLPLSAIAGGGAVAFLLVAVFARRRYSKQGGRGLCCSKQRDGTLVVHVGKGDEESQTAEELKQSDMEEVVVLAREGAAAQHPRAAAPSTPADEASEADRTTHTAGSSSSDDGQGVRRQKAAKAMAQWEWAAADLTWEEKLGAGSFGIVHRVTYTGEVFAAKRMDVSRDASTDDDRTELEAVLVREFRALQKVSHKNIVQLLGVVIYHPEWICLVMELADRGSLRQMLDRTPDVIVGKLPVQVSLAHDLASGIAYCHAQKPNPILHHDIKSANVLLFSRDVAGVARLTAKVADFGLAIGISGTSTAAATTRTKTHAAGGTLAYRGPETFNGKYTTASDVYSFSIVLWELLTGQRPWHRDADGKPYMEHNIMYLVVHKGKRPELPSSKGAAARTGPLMALMRRCWSQEPKKRPSFASIEGQLKPLLPRHSSGKLKIAQALDEMRNLRESVSELHVKVETVDHHVESGVASLASRLDSVAASLLKEVREGGEEVIRQVRLLHGSLLPEIQCVVAQQTLELSAMRATGQSSGGLVGSGGVVGWLFGSKAEEEERVAEVQRSIKAAIEAADARLRASAASVAVASSGTGGSAASAEILQKLSGMQEALTHPPGSTPGVEEDAQGSAAVLSKLDEMSAYLAKVDGAMIQMRLEADGHAQEQAKQLSLINNKLDALLTHSHEQVFSYFLLVPKPSKGYAGRTLDKLKPRHWFAKPMLLIPLYRVPSNGELRRAPVRVGRLGVEGFEVGKPLEFVKRHPRAVQLAMLALKAGIKLGASQLGVALPAASLAALSSVTDGLVSETLQLSIEAMAEEAATPKDPSDVAAALKEEERDNHLKAFLKSEAATAPPEEVLERLSASGEYNKASRREYTLLKEWLDKLHPGWEARCGLEPRVDPETGSVIWLPLEEALPPPSPATFAKGTPCTASGAASTPGAATSARARARDWLRREEEGGLRF